MILGLGCDIVQTSRFAKDNDFLFRFMQKYFSHNEIKELEEKNIINSTEKLLQSVASRFSAKEAVAKALGTGFRDGIVLRDIEILHDDLGCPKVTLYNKALARCCEISHNQKHAIHLTISNEKEYVNSVAIIEI